MGYYTRYSLVVKNANNEIDNEPIAQLRKIHETAKYSLSDDGSSKETTKWYDHDDDLRNFSKTYPDHIFVLGGAGEDPFDLWEKYYRNGKEQHCPAIITYAPMTDNAASPEMVTITKTEYDSLCYDSRKLNALVVGGVDNWEWYYESLREFYGEENEDD